MRIVRWHAIAWVLGFSPTPAWPAWQTFTTADGIGFNGILSMLETRSGDLWVGTNGGGASHYDGARWRTFEFEDGLAGNIVFGLAEDPARRLWFATNRGASSLEGTRWATYTTDQGLVFDTVEGVLATRTGDVWFRTPVGLSRYRDGRIESYQGTRFVPGDRVFTMLEASNGHVWFGTDGGAARFDGEFWTQFTSASTSGGLVENAVNAILEDPAGNLWFGTGAPEAVPPVPGRGASRLAPDSTWTPFAAPLEYSTVHAIAADRSGRIWFGTDRGARRFDGTRWEEFHAPFQLANEQVHGILVDRWGNVWFSGPSTVASGVARYDGRGWRTFREADGLGSDRVSARMLDRRGNVWFGSRAAGSALSRFDGETWRTYGAGAGLPNSHVEALLEDAAGRVWVGTDGGVSRYDGSWTTFTVRDSLANDRVRAIFEDASGRMWFGTEGGVSRYDGTWTTFTTREGLVDDRVQAILQEGDGSFWFGTAAGVSRWTQGQWTSYTRASTQGRLSGDEIHAIVQSRDGVLWFATNRGVSRWTGGDWTTPLTRSNSGLPNDYVWSLLEDEAGNLWFGTDDGLGRFDGRNWTTFTERDGLADPAVLSIHEGRSGVLWFGTIAGVTRFDGERWVSYGVADGLADPWVDGVVEDRAGHVWLGTANGLAEFEPDRVAPRSVILPRPARISPNPMQTITFGAAYGESRGVSFRSWLDGAGESPWSEIAFRTGAVADGMHRFRVIARDRVGNVDPDTAVARFEIDATAPTPTITSPTYREPVRGTVTIHGRASDARFDSLWVQFRPKGSDDWIDLGGSRTPVVEGPLVPWPTTSLPEGDYNLRLSVSDSLGLVGSTQVEVIVDNLPPYARNTAPVRVRAATGGDVYTTGTEVHLFIPPRALAEDALVTIEALSESDVPEELPGGARRALPGYRIAWSGVALLKPATLSMSLAGRADSIAGSPVLYRQVGNGTWQRVGGTVDRASGRIEAPIEEASVWAIFLEDAPPTGHDVLSPLSLTPRALTASNRELAIGFELGKSAPVTVRIYNRAGKVVREILSGVPLRAGANLVRWDGCSTDGRSVEDGLYLVSIRALGRTRSRTVAVVR